MPLSQPLAWDDLYCGYEGTFGPNFGVMYGIVIERGLFIPPDPEWLPADETVNPICVGINP